MPSHLISFCSRLMVVLQKICPYYNSQNLCEIWKMVSKDVIKFLEMESLWYIEERGPTSNGECTYGRHTWEKHRKEEKPFEDTEFRLMQPQAQECWQPPKLEDIEADLSEGLWRECGPTNTLIWDFSIVLNHQVIFSNPRKLMEPGTLMLNYK